jgi:hypothetical protein
MCDVKHDDGLIFVPDDTASAVNDNRPRAERLRDSFGILEPADLAVLLGVDERTLATWRARKSGPDFVKLGRAVFYRRQDVEDWMALNVTSTDRAA